MTAAQLIEKCRKRYEKEVGWNSDHEEIVEAVVKKRHKISRPKLTGYNVDAALVLSAIASELKAPKSEEQVKEAFQMIQNAL